MPTLRNITIALQSQYDALLIPERLLGETNERGNISNGQNTITVEVPIYPSSQFWISYCCPAPDPVDSFRFWYFKLSANGAHLASWGCGEKDRWCGKTVFALSRSGTDLQGRSVVGKRGLFFPNADDEATQATFEIKAYRSLGRRRAEADEGSYASGSPGVKGGLQTASMGRLKKGEARQHYQYALLDAVDEPYATFHFHFEPAHSEASIPSPPVSIGPSTAKPGQASELGTSSRHVDAAPASCRVLSFPTTGSLLLLPSQVKPRSVSPCKTTSGQEMPKRNAGGAADEKCALPVLADRGDMSLAERAIPRKPLAQSLNPGVSLKLTESTTLASRAGTGSMGILRGVINNALRRRNGEDASTHG